MEKVTIKHLRLQKTILPVLVTLLLLVLPLQQGNSTPPAKKLKLSGTWTLNETKSEFGEYGRMWASNKLVIVHKGKTLTIERTSADPNGGEYKVMENYTLDGKETVNPIMEDSKKTSAVSMSEDKQSLIIKSVLDLVFDGQEMKIETIETFSLSEDGSSLVIDGVSMTDFGDMTVKFVYDKN